MNIWCNKPEFFHKFQVFLHSLTLPLRACWCRVWGFVSIEIQHTGLELTQYTKCCLKVKLEWSPRLYINIQFANICNNLYLQKTLHTSKDKGPTVKALLCVLCLPKRICYQLTGKLPFVIYSTHISLSYFTTLLVNHLLELLSQA